jgi:hypothetical protein
VHEPPSWSFGGVGISQQLIAINKLINAAAFFDDLFLSSGRFDAGKHFDNAVLRPSGIEIRRRTGLKN